MINKLFLVGRLTKDPETTQIVTRKTGEIKHVTKVGLAVNDGFGDNEHVSFFDLEIWNGAGKRTAEYCHKGDQIMVECVVQQDSWTDSASGQKRYRYRFIANNVQFGSKKAGPTMVEGAQSAEEEAEPPAKGRTRTRTRATA
jgi:single-strand DNA-binding protein